MSYSLNSLKTPQRGGRWGSIQGNTLGVIKRDSWSLDYSSYGIRAPEEESDCDLVGLRADRSPWLFKRYCRPNLSGSVDV